MQVAWIALAFQLLQLNKKTPTLVSPLSTTQYHLLRSTKNPIVAIMDPLSCLAIAGAVVQFVDFGSQIVVEFLSLYKAGESVGFSQ
jgi:hypothetical protein